LASAQHHLYCTNNFRLFPDPLVWTEKTQKKKEKILEFEN